MSSTASNLSTRSVPEIPARWRNLLRGLGGGFLLLLSGLFVISLPTRYTELTRICIEERCPVLWLTPDTAAALQNADLSIEFYAAYHTIIELIAVVVCAILCLFVFYAHSHTWMGLMTAVVVLASPIFVLNSVWTFIQVHQQYAILVEFIQDVTVIALFGFMHLFPSGRFVPGWARWNLLLIAIWQFVTFVHVGNPLATYARALYGLGFILLGILSAMMIGAVLYRYRRVLSMEQKQQVKWVVMAIVVTVLGTIDWVLFFEFFPPSDGQALLLNNTLHYPFALATQVAIPAGITIAILRYRLWDIDIIINRTLVYGALTMIVAAIYVVIVAGSGRLFHNENNLVASLAATGVIAVIFHPLRSRLQLNVNRWLYGERDDPAGVLTRLTSQLETTGSAGSLLAVLVETIASSLKLPYVALWLYAEDGALTLITQTGVQRTEVETLPLLHQQESVGQLQVAPRAPGEALSTEDRQLLAAIARLTAATARTIQLTDQVQEARVRTVSAREEERRRLRRDLHDGLGPVLASQGLKLAAARQLVREKPEVAERLLDEVMSQSENTVAEIRRLVYALRPPTLDELGLVEAIREHVQVVGTNAAVSIAVDDGLHIHIQDDGIGLRQGNRSGVGLQSMRERAVEVGGVCTIENGEERGVVVRLSLPIQAT
jgi:signal transduction histidine kinase